MGLHLIVAAVDPAWFEWLLWTVYVLEVVVGLGLVIFVHELGHFLVAKLCGVKCEKFYLGFDIAGLKLARFRWGETEYGIGILPLGGYVKMLGQEDNPARLREEIERARQQQAVDRSQQAADGGDQTAGSSHQETDSGQQEADRATIDIEAAEKALYDPRSYLAQSVPKRMAIISAGVVMNVLFAVLAGSIAYAIGVRQIECAVGSVFPGEAAWRADFRVGDVVEETAGKPARRFSDLQKAVSLGDNIEQGVTFRVRRPGVPEPITLIVTPDRKRLAPTIGIGNNYTTTLHDRLPVLPGSTAALARPTFRGGDRIVRLDETPVERYDQIHAYLARHPEKKLLVTVERQTEQGDGQAEASGPTRPLTIAVAPRPVRRLGLVMEMGPVAAVQANSPAAEAGIQPGDRILKIDGQPAGDPETLPERLRRLAKTKGQIALTVQREGRGEPLALPAVTLRPPDTYTPPAMEGNPLAVPVLGVAYDIHHRVEAVEPGSPAAAAGMKPGDAIRQAKLIPPDKDALAAEDLGTESKDFQLDVEPIAFRQKANWAFFSAYLLQVMLPGTRVELTLEDDRQVTLEPVDSTEWFNPDRGFAFRPLAYTQKAASLADAIVLGSRETWDSLTLVFRSVRKLSTRQVSPKALGGPWEIIKQAIRAAAQGLSPLLIFLTLISANLAVLNFLPIPVLDGGHMVFLAYEGITGRPPNERVHVGLMYLGLIFILALMIWVLGLDFNLIRRH